MTNCDPATMRAHARRLFATAGVLRDVATRLAAAATSTPWYGKAADAFQQRAAQIHGYYLRAADRVEDAAWTISRHADAVEAALAALRSDPSTGALCDALGRGWRVGDELTGICR